MTTKRKRGTFADEQPEVAGVEEEEEKEEEEEEEEELVMQHRAVHLDKEGVLQLWLNSITWTPADDGAKKLRFSIGEITCHQRSTGGCSVRLRLFIVREPDCQHYDFAFCDEDCDLLWTDNTKGKQQAMEGREVVCGVLQEAAGAMEAADAGVGKEEEEEEEEEEEAGEDEEEGAAAGEAEADGEATPPCSPAGVASQEEDSEVAGSHPEDRWASGPEVDNTQAGSNGMLYSPLIRITHDGFGLASFIYAAHLLQWVHNEFTWPQTEQTLVEEELVAGEYRRVDIVRGGPASFEWARGREAKLPARLIGMLNYICMGVGPEVMDNLSFPTPTDEPFVHIATMDCGFESGANRHKSANPFDSEQGRPLKAALFTGFRARAWTILMELSTGAHNDRFLAQLKAYFGGMTDDARLPHEVHGGQRVCAGDIYELVLLQVLDTNSAEYQLHVVNGSHMYVAWARRDKVPQENRGQHVVLVASSWGGKQGWTQDVGQFLPSRQRVTRQRSGVQVAEGVGFSKQSNYDRSPELELPNPPCTYVGDLNTDTCNYRVQTNTVSRPKGSSIDQYVNSSAGWQGHLDWEDWMRLHWLPFTTNMNATDPLYIKLPVTPVPQTLVTAADMSSLVAATIPAPQAYDVLQSLYVHMQVNGIKVPLQFPYDKLNADRLYHFSGLQSNRTRQRLRPRTPTEQAQTNQQSKKSRAANRHAPRRH